MFIGISVGPFKEWIKGICVDRGRGNSTSAETPPLFSMNGIKKILQYLCYFSVWVY